jgi:hypothetical protein
VAALTATRGTGRLASGYCAWVRFWNGKLEPSTASRGKFLPLYSKPSGVFAVSLGSTESCFYSTNPRVVRIRIRKHHSTSSWRRSFHARNWSTDSGERSSLPIALPCNHMAHVLVEAAPGAANSAPIYGVLGVGIAWAGPRSCRAPRAFVQDPRARFLLPRIRVGIPGTGILLIYV